MRRDIGPEGFAPLAAQVFVAVRTAGGDAICRLAGEAITGLHGRPLRGESLVRLWRPEHRGRLTLRLGQSFDRAAPVVVVAEAAAGGARLALEILFAPLAGPADAPEQFLGLYQPLASRSDQRIGELVMTLDAAERVPPRPPLRLATVDGRRIA